MGLGIVTLSVAIAALIGNIISSDQLRNFTPWGTHVKTNASICLALISICALFAARYKDDRIRLLILTCAGIAGAIGLITFLEWVLHWDAGIDQLLFPENKNGGTFAGRMPPNAAITFFMLALSIGAGVWSRNKNISQVFAIGGLFVSALAVLGHTYGLDQLTRFGASTLIAFPLAVSLVLLSAACFMSFTENGMASLIVRNSLGGTVARWLLPVTMLFPLLGMFNGIGDRDAVDVYLLAVANCIGLPVIIWLAARAVDKMDEHREQAYKEAIAAREEAVRAQLVAVQASDSARQAQADAERANGFKSDFISTVSHEIRTPLAGVIGLTEILTKEDLPPTAKELANASLDASMRLLRILNDLLDFQKIEAGKIELERTNFEIAPVVNAAVQSILPESNKKHLTVELSVAANLPKVVCGDELRLRQILLNLLSNAVKFTHEGKISLVVKVEKIEPASIWIKLSVKDTGIGVEEDTKALIFEPFAQQDSSITRKLGGTGLGLSIVRRFVELMGGRMGPNSVAGDGSLFWFLVPFPSGDGSPCQ